MQLVLVLLMLVAFGLIGQSWSLLGYQVGLLLMLTTALTQIAFGNIEPATSLGRTLYLYVLFTVITAAIFGLSIWLAPVLIQLGR